MDPLSCFEALEWYDIWNEAEVCLFEAAARLRPREKESAHYVGIKIFR